MNKTYKICSKCIMDSSANEITFDENGVCNFCNEYQKNIYFRISQEKEANAEFNKIVAKIKKSNRNKKYNCIIGISGGVDSTYLAYLAKKNGLTPLAVHLDNGWNSELAVNNIEMALKKLDIDLYTYVINWEEFRDLQLSFIKSSTPDLEIPTDHGIYAVLMQLANKFGIKYILTGLNYKDESIMPKSWSYGHADWKYIKSVHKLFGTKKLKTFPHYSLFYLFYTIGLRQVKIISLLNYIDYNKNNAMEVLENELSWRKYEGKHFESIYTRFYQSYYLPVKFGIDKRRAHFSNQINNGSITRELALEAMKEPIYPEDLIEKDKKFFIKKLNITAEDFENFLKAPSKDYTHYPNNESIITNIRKIVAYLRKLNLMPK
ncbi:MAG: N-acetyl sugar amidotransferase [Bacteroidales bacterium]